jgi:hypothetical protein
MAAETSEDIASSVQLGRVLPRTTRATSIFMALSIRRGEAGPGRLPRQLASSSESLRRSSHLLCTWRSSRQRRSSCESASGCFERYIVHAVYAALFNTTSSTIFALRRPHSIACQLDAPRKVSGFSRSWTKRGVRTPSHAHVLRRHFRCLLCAALLAPQHSARTPQRGGASCYKLEASSDAARRRAPFALAAGDSR